MCERDRTEDVRYSTKGTRYLPPLGQGSYSPLHPPFVRREAVPAPSFLHPPISLPHLSSSHSQRMLSAWDGSLYTFLFLLFGFSGSLFSILLLFVGFLFRCSFFSLLFPFSSSSLLFRFLIRTIYIPTVFSLSSFLSPLSHSRNHGSTFHNQL